MALKIVIGKLKKNKKKLYFVGQKSGEKALREGKGRVWVFFFPEDIY